MFHILELLYECFKLFEVVTSVVDVVVEVIITPLQLIIILNYIIMLQLQML